MPHKYFTILVVIFLLVVTGVALGAKAERAARGSDWQPIVNLPVSGTPEDDAQLAKQSGPTTATALLGPEDNFVGYKIGSTSYDKQHNGTMGRQIALGGDGRIHFDWTHKTGSAGVRETYYNSALYSGGQWLLSHDTSGVPISGVNGGYCNIDAWWDLGVPIWHEGPTDNAYSIYSGIDFSSGSASFSTSQTPVGGTCSWNTSNGSDGAGNYTWPIHHVDVGFSNDPRIHVVGQEPTTGDIEQSFVYFQGQGNPTNWGTCGIFVDSVTDIAGVVRQDPNSDNVVIVWIEPRNYGPDEDQYNNDLVYVQSSDGGMTWGSVNNITNHVDSDMERPYSNLSAMYTSDGCFHIVWDSPGYDQGLGVISTAECKMYHWDDCNQCISLVIDADNSQACAPGNWNRNVSKMNLAECDGDLYVVYTYFTGDTNEGTTDCSNGGWANGEIYAQVSSTGGVTWGPPTNLTNTPSNGCTSGNCTSEQWSSTVMYADSLYTLYVGDTDAGSAPENAGAWTANPIMFMVNHCFEMVSYVDLAASPNLFAYPIHVAPGQTVDTSFVLQNSGNTSALWSSSISYYSGSGWITSVVPSSGSVPPGCFNTQTVDLSFSGPATEGLYEATIHIDYAKAVQDIDVELYCFDPFCLPEYVRLRTTANVLTVAQESRAGNQTRDGGFAWFADTTNYLLDGGLIIGNSVTGQYDFNLYHTLAETAPAGNPWGRLYTTDCMPVVDTMLAGKMYRTVSGTGVNHDSTIGFMVEWYASGHPDSNSFYVAHIALGPGPKYTGDISNVVVAYATDWDIPSDTGQDNLGYYDATLQTVYQQGLYAGSPYGNDQREAGIAYRGHNDATAFADGGIVWDNARHVYPTNGYHVDTLQNRLPSLSGWQTDIPDSLSYGADLNSIIVVDNNATISGDKGTNPEFNLVFWGINPNQNPSDTKESILAKADAFICTYISPDGPYCPQPPCNCGDADSSGTISINDAVYIVRYLAGLVEAPEPYCLGDADGCGTVDIADAAYLIEYIFAGGDPPGCDPFGECELPTGNNAVTLGCPVVADPSSGDSVGIPVYLTNEVDLYSLSLGFVHNSADVEVTSFSFEGSILPITVPPQTAIYPSNNQVLTIWASFNALAPQSGGLAGTIWVQVPVGTEPQAIDFDSAFVAPDGRFMLGPEGGGRIVPQYNDCGDADLIIGDSCASQYPGDVDNDGDIDPLDLNYLVSFLLGSGPAPDPLSNGDVDGSCCIDTFDIAYLRNYIYYGGPLPAECTCVHPGTLCHDVCGNSFTDPVFIICPGGDAEFEVHLRDECNKPVPNINSVWVALYDCEDMEFCEDQPPLDSIPPLSPSDAAGVLRFVYAGGTCDQSCYAVVKIPDGRCDIATVPVLALDRDGDLGVGLSDTCNTGGHTCCDFNGNGVDDNQDFDLFLDHLGHYCGLTPCERFGVDFEITPATNHIPGTNVRLDLLLTNNNFDSCHIEFVEFYYSPTGSGQNEQWFHTEEFDKSLAPGEEDTVSVQYTVPSTGDGCVVAKFNTDCCSTQVVRSVCFQYDWHCTADTSYCYEFIIRLTGIPPVLEAETVSRYLNPNWPPLEILHWPTAFPVIAPDSIHYRVCTIPGAELGAKSTLYTFLTEQGAAQRRLVRNAVVITDQTGDCNGDCLVNITDAVYLIIYIFAGGDEPLPYRAGDVNCDGVVNITDAVYIINYIFNGGPEPCLIDPFF